MKKAIVTGATGSIGSTLIDILVNNGYYVYAVIRSSTSNIRNLTLRENVRVVSCDLKDYKVLPSLIHDNCDIFYHLAWSGVKKEDKSNKEIQENNVKYTLEAIECAKQLGCHTFVGAGSQAEFGPKNEIISPLSECHPITEYGIHKLDAHNRGRELCTKYNINFFFPRIFSVYGPKDNDYTMIKSTLKKMINNEEINFTEATQLWEYIYTEDASNALFLIGEKGINGHEYNISSEDTRPLRDFIIRMKELADSNSKLNFGVIPYSEGVINLNSDISALKNDVSFEEHYNFDDGINFLLKKTKK